MYAELKPPRRVGLAPFFLLICLSRQVKKFDTALSLATHCVIVLSAVPSDFDSAMTTYSPFKQYVLAAYAHGVRFVVFVLNKQDQAGWQQELFNQQCTAVTELCGKVGFAPNRVKFVPTSAREGKNISSAPADATSTPWLNQVYQGNEFFLKPFLSR